MQCLLIVPRQLGSALGGDGGCRLVRILRLVRRATAAPTVTPTAVGFDNFALCHVQRYGAIIVQLKHVMGRVVSAVSPPIRAMCAVTGPPMLGRQAASGRGGG